MTVRSPGARGRATVSRRERQRLAREREQRLSRDPDGRLVELARVADVAVGRDQRAQVGKRVLDARAGGPGGDQALERPGGRLRVRALAGL